MTLSVLKYENEREYTRANTVLDMESTNLN